ncbi:AEC family transporter [Acetatifactor muris]|uniref:Membrane transport protein n=2 Tax=Acetatifactor muris TaxID=879566 RepID=A0A2K4ZPL7_9FIRM|nr:AEC family transporter [Acetatifactor muris]MCR2050891.1 AEC family transporter [Acetatifactor muris]SOY32438.1 Membrane transport protein [Acetatifactor muris]
MTLFTVFFQMLALLIMIGAGFFLTKTGMMDAHTNTQMSKMIVNLFNPLLILSSAANSAGLVSLQTMGTIALIASGMFVIFILVGMLLSPLFDKSPDQRKIFQMMFVFSNLGFIGIPVVSSILGEEYVVYVSEFLLIYTLVFYTYGVALMDGKFSPSSLKAMVNPGTVSALASMVIIVLGIQLPDFVKTAISYLGNVTSPMALVAVGFTLAHSDLKKIFGQPKLYLFSVIKLLVLPLLMLPLLKLAANSQELISVCIVMFGMPIGNMPLILGNQKGIDGSTCSAAIILTTLLCVLTIPVLLTVAG